MKRIRASHLSNFVTMYTHRQLTSGAYTKCAAVIAQPVMWTIDTLFFERVVDNVHVTPNRTANHEVLSALHDCAFENGDAVLDLKRANVFLSDEGVMHVVDCSFFALHLLDDTHTAIDATTYPNLYGDPDGIAALLL